MTMILRGRGLKVSLNDCREQLGTGRDGVDVWSLVTLARSTGLESTAYRVTDPAALRDLPLPAIAHWEESHFVVIERFGRRGLGIVDPARGRRVVGVEEQDRCLTGVVVTFGGPAKPPQPQWAVPREHHDHRMRRSAARLLRGAVARLLVLSLLLQVFGLALPVGTAMVFDHLLPTREAGLLPLLAVAIVGLVVTQFVLAQLRSHLLVRLQARVDREIMTKLLSHLLALPYRFFSRRSSGDLMQRLASSILLRELVTTQVLSAVIDGLFVMLYLVLLFTRDVPFALIALVIGGVQVLAVLVLHGRLMRLRHRQLTVQAEAEGVLMEALMGIATVKAMGAERRVFDNWQRHYSRALRMDSSQSQVSAIVENTASTIRLAAPLAPGPGAVDADAPDVPRDQCTGPALRDIARAASPGRVRGRARGGTDGPVHGRGARRPD